jgi:hypothetical protein
MLLLLQKAQQEAGDLEWLHCRAGFVELASNVRPRLSWLNCLDFTTPGSGVLWTQPGGREEPLLVAEDILVTGAAGSCSRATWSGFRPTADDASEPSLDRVLHRAQEYANLPVFLRTI